LWHLQVEMADGLASSLRRARREPSAFGAFYASQSRQMLAFFARRTFDIEAARDLTAETFAQAFEHRRRFRGSTDAEAAAWLYGIARHQLSRYGRNGKVERKALERLGVQVPTVSGEDYDHIVELAGLAELRDRVVAVFGELSDDQRDALRLRVIDERPYAEVALELGISEQTARARVSRALRRLADATDMTSAVEVTP
jgi:RNA polymerase sigma factor (sigma-70 family)